MVRVKRVLAASLMAACLFAASAIMVSAQAPGEEGLEGAQASNALLPVQPRVGDRAVFVGGGAERDESGWTSTRSLTLAVEWLPDELVRAASGDEALVNRLQLWVGAAETDEDDEGDDDHSHGSWSAERIMNYDPATGLVYSVEMSSQKEATYTWNDDSYSSTARSTTTVYHSLPWICGLRDPWHLTGELVATATVEVCNRHSYDGMQSEPATASMDGGLLHVQSDSGAIELWIDAASSFPVRILMHKLPSGDEAVMYELVAFEAGDGPPLATSKEALSYGAAPPRAPLRPWILDEGGVSLPLGIEEAYDVAMDEPGSAAAAFMDEHPDAVLVDAYGAFDRGNNGMDMWVFEWAAGTEGVKAIVYQYEVDPLYPIADSPIAIPMGPDVSFEDHPPDKPVPAPDVIPDRLPTLHAMVDIWRSHLPAARSDAPVTSVAVSFSCRGADCSSVHPIMTVGYGRHELSGDTMVGGATGEREHTYEDARMFFTPDGRAHQFTTNLHPETGEPEFVEPESSSPQPLVASKGPLALAAVPFPDTPTAATIGATSLLVSLVYLLWPHAKQFAFLGLFSRIGRDRVLQHPIRDRLVGLLASEPGLHVEEIVRRIGVPRGSVRHHLRKLRDERLIVEERQGRRRSYRLARGTV